MHEGAGRGKDQSNMKSRREDKTGTKRIVKQGLHNRKYVLQCFEKLNFKSTSLKTNVLNILYFKI